MPNIQHVPLLYPIALLGAPEIDTAEIVRFGGFPFWRTIEGEWCLVDGAREVDTDD